MTINEAIRHLALTGEELYCRICTVDAVDEQERTVDCTPLDDGTPLLGVNLQANQGGADGVVAIPAVGSYVVVAFLSPAVAVVVLTDVVDRLLFKVGETTGEITAGGIVLNGGDEGMVKLVALVDRMNAIEGQINDLRSALSLWVAVPNDGGAALKASIAAWLSQPITPTVRGDLEDEKIKH
jgi:hypothetical protein